MEWQRIENMQVEKKNGEKCCRKQSKLTVKSNCF